MKTSTRLVLRDVLEFLLVRLRALRRFAKQQTLRRLCDASRPVSQCYTAPTMWRRLTRSRPSPDDRVVMSSRDDDDDGRACARWPPFLSASVRVAHSIANGLPDWANHVSSLRSIVAPRLSELDTNMYLYPCESSVSRCQCGTAPTMGHRLTRPVSQSVLRSPCRGAFGRTLPRASITR